MNSHKKKLGLSVWCMRCSRSRGRGGGGGGGGGRAGEKLLARGEVPDVGLLS